MYCANRKALAAFILALAILFPSLVEAQRKRRRTRQPPRAYQTRTYTEAITPGASTISPGQFAYFTALPPRSAASASLFGRFRAQGGERNDIEVYVLDSDGFENWRNGNRAPTLYNSGRVTVANINVQLPPGQTYYLIFNNRFSIFSNKAVVSDIRLTYEQLESGR